jgi:hypothetical protein
MKTILNLIVALLLAMLVGACSSSSDNSVTGVFVDDPVEGLEYVCSSGLVGVTNADGEYTCTAGDNVTFSIGAVTIGTIEAQTSIITPYSFFPDDIDSALNLARLLQSIDSTPDDGLITLNPTLVALLAADTDFSSVNFESDVETALGVALVSVADALTQLNTSILSEGGEIPDGANIPVANAGPDQNVNTTSLVTLVGSGSSDADGDPLTYIWSFTSKPDGSSAALSSTTAVNPTFTADLNGSYILQLVVNDGMVDSAADTVTITATASISNVAPVANAGPNQNVITTSIVALDGSGSSDADAGDTLTYLWSFTSKPSGSSATLSNTTIVNPTFTADLDGDYALQLIVNDGTVDSAPDTVTVTATTANATPVANAGIDQSVDTLSVVTLDGSGSSDADAGDTLTYLWSFTSKPSGSSAALSSTTIVNPTFTADLAGDYVVQLIVNDATVNSSPDTVTVTATDSVVPTYGTVTSPYTGKIWHDRNLGATQVCTAPNDTACYGDYYQWGRNADGHQIFTSPTTATQATNVTTVGHGDFIAIASYPFDWGSDVDSTGATRKANWSAVDGTSVCPAGFRLPTMTELNNEIISGDIGYSVQPYNTFLKLPSAGGRYADTGDMYGEGSLVYLWSSDTYGSESYSMYYTGIYGQIDVTTDVARGGGIAVRCIKH